MEINFDSNGLIPAIIQDNNTQVVLMLGYMNSESYKKTIETKKVTFYSRKKKRLWVKGEESGNFLNLVSIDIDCDNDTLLVRVRPEGEVCHKGNDTCWNKKNEINYGFLSELESTINERKLKSDNKNSYVTNLFKEGINRIAQKVGEEAVETIIEAKGDKKKLFINESADLLFHFLILLQAKGFLFKDVVDKLEERKK